MMDALDYVYTASRSDRVSTSVSTRSVTGSGTVSAVSWTSLSSTRVTANAVSQTSEWLPPNCGGNTSYPGRTRLMRICCRARMRLSPYAKKVNVSDQECHKTPTHSQTVWSTYLSTWGLEDFDMESVPSVTSPHQRITILKISPEKLASAQRALSSNASRQRAIATSDELERPSKVPRFPSGRDSLGPETFLIMDVPTVETSANLQQELQPNQGQAS